MDAGGKIGIVVFGQNQKATIIGDQMQSIVLIAVTPADPFVTSGTRWVYTLFHAWGFSNILTLANASRFSGRNVNRAG